MIARSRYDRHDALVEGGRSWRPDGAEIRNYTCGQNRITARVSAERVELERKLGVVCPGLDVALADLYPLVAFLGWWQEHRTGWAAFYWTGSGHPPGWGGASAFYQPPGRALQVRVAVQVMGKVQGEDFTGRDYVCASIRPPERVAGVADLVARVIRRGEKLGDPGGEEVGGIYRCGELGIEAERNGVTVRHGKRWIAIEPEEHLFLKRLLDVERALPACPR